MPNAVESATAAARELAALIRDRLPIACGTDRWPSLGWALLARMAGTTGTIVTLRSSQSANDGFCLLRVLYEHVVTFAWLAADPVDERIDLFRKNDAIERIKADNDLRSIGDYSLEPETRRQLEALRDSIAGNCPKVPQRAEIADLYWKDRIEEFVEDSTSPYSFRGMYRQLYRHGSFLVHPTLLGLNKVTTQNPDGTRTIHMEAVDRPPFPIGLTVVVQGAALIVAEHALQWPPLGTVNNIVSSHNWVPETVG
ncbi:MAG: hypothetical protein HY271_17830 [Deltaproteobacteria bacterium]|nr:hypothetical protein [Deltaproteobacteria bacterium]